MTLPILLAILGPTGVGKTHLTLELADAMGAEVLSVDSLQIYKYLDVGTAKASVEERDRVPHHLMDILNPDEDCHVARFLQLADAAIKDIHSRGRHVIAVGGTNLYMRALIHGLFDAPPPDETIRARHRELANYYGIHWLYQELQRIDPELATRIHAQDLVRISRGLEVFEQTGTCLSRLQDAHRFATPRFNALKIAVCRPRQQLYAAINTRVDRMIKQGLLEEYQSVLNLGYSPDLKPLNALGYRHARQHLYEGQPLDDMVETLKKDTRRFAKQQLSWLRSEPQVHWMLADSFQDATIRPDIIRDVQRFFDQQPPELAWTTPQDPHKS